MLLWTSVHIHIILISLTHSLPLLSIAAHVRCTIYTMSCLTITRLMTSKYHVTVQPTCMTYFFVVTKLDCYITNNNVDNVIELLPIRRRWPQVICVFGGMSTIQLLPLSMSRRDFKRGACPSVSHDPMRISLCLARVRATLIRRQSLSRAPVYDGLDGTL